jgi:predicted  nucleic acid-binding Zn-ribbon protein
MSQYHDPTAKPSTATNVGARQELRDNRDEIQRMREQITQQQSLIDRLQRDLRQLRNRVDQHAEVVNRINRG